MTAALATWEDIVGGAAFAPVSTAPQVNATGQNGRQTIDCLSAGENMRAPFAETDSTYTFVFVATLSSGSAAWGRILSVNDSADAGDESGTGSFTLVRNSSGSSVSLFRNGASTGTHALGYDTWAVFTIELNGTDTRLYINNTLAGTRAVGNALNATHLGIFYEVASGGNENARGRLGDLIVVNRALDSTERTKACDLMVSLFGL